MCESVEFQTFLRPQGELKRALETLPRQSTTDLLERFRQAMPINEEVDEFLINKYNVQINDFIRDCRDFMENLKRFKKSIKMIVPIKEQEVQYYKDFLDFL